jgi:ParB family transcriptional regulator, chromosome partitioning protein
MRIGDLIISNCNIRTGNVSDIDIESLSESIKSHKLISKLVLRKNSEGVYEVIAGRRRLKALKNIFGEDYELPEDEYIIMDVDDGEAFIISLTENVNRVNLSPMDLNRAYLRLNQMGKKDKEIALLLNVSPHRLKRLASLSMDITRMPEEAKEELSKPITESKLNDLHWSHISNKTEDPEVIKDTVDYILDHETIPKDVPSILRSIEKQHKDNETVSDLGDDSSTEEKTSVSQDVPINYTHKGELFLIKEGDKETLKVIGKDEDEEVPIDHYLEYLRHPEDFKCYVTFKLKIKPIDK